MSNPSQGYKLPESVPGSGQSGISGQNTNQAPLASTGNNATTVQEEVGASLPADFSIKNTKAETKGEENLIPNPESNSESMSTLGSGGDKIRQPVHAHDIDIPQTAPHMPPQSNESSKEPGSALR